MTISKALTTAYYHLKPIIPRRFQIWLRSKVVFKMRISHAKAWPILEKAGRIPDKWPGWPQNKRFALVLTHDVETARGQEKSYRLMEIEKNLGFRSSFNFVPERYKVSAKLRSRLKKHGFEVGVHGLNHDGKLYASKRIFQKRAGKINHYLKAWNAVGFRSPAMHHNLKWIHDLDIEYDLSTFDTDPFEPQPDGAETIFPFWVQGNSSQNGYVELPCTMPQDFVLFILMKERDIKVWASKLDWIVEHGGMVLLNTHPDYMNFNGGKPGLEQYSIEYYQSFLEHVKNEYQGLYWHGLPCELASFFTSKSQNQGF